MIQDDTDGRVDEKPITAEQVPIGKIVRYCLQIAITKIIIQFFLFWQKSTIIL